MGGVRVVRADSGGLVDSSGAFLSVRIPFYCLLWNPQALHVVIRDVDAVLHTVAVVHTGAVVYAGNAMHAGIVVYTGAVLHTADV
eukprot:2200877-Pyramimonas_sp.AAC.1